MSGDTRRSTHNSENAVKFEYLNGKASASPTIFEFVRYLNYCTLDNTANGVLLWIRTVPADPNRPTNFKVKFSPRDFSEKTGLGFYEFSSLFNKRKSVANRLCVFVFYSKRADFIFSVCIYRWLSFDRPITLVTCQGSFSKAFVYYLIKHRYNRLHNTIRETTPISG